MTWSRPSQLFWQWRACFELMFFLSSNLSLANESDVKNWVPSKMLSGLLEIYQKRSSYGSIITNTFSWMIAVLSRHWCCSFILCAEMLYDMCSQFTWRDCEIRQAWVRFNSQVTLLYNILKAECILESLTIKKGFSPEKLIMKLINARVFHVWIPLAKHYHVLSTKKKNL